MKCPYCSYLKSNVVNSRVVDDGSTIRRRRLCRQCNKRFTTYEKVKELPLIVIKKDERREKFDRNKILNGLLKACEKRPVPMEIIDNLTDDIERECRNMLKKEIPSRDIGLIVMDKLKKIDKVAYVRFASVYKEFQDVDTFMEEIKNLKEKRPRKKYLD